MALRVTRQYADVLGTGDGKVRVTRQYVEVLGTGDSKARVSRQYVEILSAMPDAQVSRQSIAVLGNPPADGCRVTQQSVAALVGRTTTARVAQECVEIVGGAPEGGNLRVQQCVIEVLADPIGVISVSAADTLTLSHDGSLADICVLGEDNLVLTHAAGVTAEWSRATSDVLGLSDGATGGKIYTVSAADSLALSDEGVGDALKFVSDTLTLTHAATVDAIKPVADTLTVTHTATVLVVRDCQVADTLALDDLIVLAATAAVQGRDSFDLTDAADVILVVPIMCAAQDTLTVGHSAVVHLCRPAVDTLELTDVAEFEMIRPAADSLNLTEDIVTEWVYGRRVIDTLALTHSAVVGRIRLPQSSSTIALTDVATADIIRTASDTIVVTHTAEAHRTRVATDTLELTDAAEVSTNHVGAQDDLLDLSHTAIAGFVRSRDATDRLRLSDSCRSGIEIGAASDLLQEVHFDVDPVTGQATEYYVGLQDRADAALVPFAPKPVSDTLAVWDTALAVVIHEDAIDGSASDTLALTQLATCEQFPVVRDAQHAAHVLVLSDVAYVELVRPAASTLSLTDVAVVSIDRATMPVVDTLTLGQSVGFWLVQASVLQRYTPFIGDGAPDSPTPPPASCPVPNATGTTRLCYPVSHPTDFLTLRSPEFGNKDRLQMNRISRETRGGTLIVYADPMWPKLETLVLTFRGLSRTQVQDYLTFVNDHLGMEVGFVDWEGFYWKGVIMNPEEPTVQDGKEIFTISFEFECEPATWEP